MPQHFHRQRRRQHAVDRRDQRHAAHDAAARIHAQQAMARAPPHRVAPGCAVLPAKWRRCGVGSVAVHAERRGPAGCSQSPAPLLFDAGDAECHGIAGAAHRPESESLLGSFARRSASFGIQRFDEARDVGRRHAVGSGISTSTPIAAGPVSAIASMSSADDRARPRPLAEFLQAFLVDGDDHRRRETRACAAQSSGSHRTAPCAVRRGRARPETTIAPARQRQDAAPSGPAVAATSTRARRSQTRFPATCFAPAVCAAVGGHTSISMPS